MENIETTNLGNWEEFREEIKKIRDEHGKSSFDGTEFNFKILYRGQSDSNWGLESTLERVFPEELFKMKSYLKIAEECKPEIESLAKRKWKTLSKEEIEKDASFEADLPNIEYLVHLRHCGFPSPLLDWTRSPYVAAYFAFREAPFLPISPKKKVAIFVCIHKTVVTKATFLNGPTIGPIRIVSSGNSTMNTERGSEATHPRHFAQKAEYTFATKLLKDNVTGKNEYFFCGHSEAANFESEMGQVKIIKITLPESEWLNAFEELHDYNISEFTLFQTEDALMRDLARRKLLHPTDSQPTIIKAV